MPNCARRRGSGIVIGHLRQVSYRHDEEYVHCREEIKLGQGGIWLVSSDRESCQEECCWAALSYFKISEGSEQAKRRDLAFLPY